MPYYWIKAEYNGKLIVLGAYQSEEEANEIGYRKLDIPFEVVSLPTKDMTRATRILKARRLNETENINFDNIISRAKHNTGGQV